MIELSLPRTASSALLLMCLSAAAVEPIVIDGEFDDWASDGAGGGSPAPVALVRDADALYLSLTLEEPRNIQSMPLTLALVFAAADWGRESAPYRGIVALKVLEFSPPGEAGSRYGARTLIPRDGRWQAVPLAGSGVLSAPTYSSTRFEIRIPEGEIPAGAAAIAIVRWDEESVARTPSILLADIARLEDRPGPARPSVDRPADAQLRVLVWNIGGEGFERHLEGLWKLVSRLNIDVLMLDEAPPDLGAALSASLPHGWQALAGASGGRQRGVLASRFQLEAVPEFSHLAYPQEALELVSEEGTAFMRDDLSDAAREGVAAAAAVLDFDDRRWLLLSADLQCCGRDGSVEDRFRIHQARVIRAALRRSVAARPQLSGVIVGGDLNLVGSRTPLDLLGDGTGVGGGRLAVAPALQLDGRSNHTWGPAGDRFPPGRLDFVLHGPALGVRQAVVLNGDDLDRLAEGLREASDHFPLLVDFYQLRGPAPGDDESTR